MNLMRFLGTFVCLFSCTQLTLLAGDCATFYCNFDEIDAIAKCNGTVNGGITFVGGINGMAARFDGATSIRFITTLFDTPNGSVSLWFKKNSSDKKGGVLEIGQLGAPDSVGVFYANSDNVYFEMRNSANQPTVACAEHVLSERHLPTVMAMWM